MDAFDNPTVEAVFANYPTEMNKKMMALRQLILDTASETECKHCHSRQ